MRTLDVGERGARRLGTLTPIVREFVDDGSGAQRFGHDSSGAGK